MPRIELVLFREGGGGVPFDEWLADLPEKAQSKCLESILRLEEMGHELRRPHADYLGEGIYELRVRHLGINYRMLYFFHGRSVVVLSHGFTKQEAAVPSGMIQLAQRRRHAFESNPSRHSFRRGS